MKQRNKDLDRLGQLQHLALALIQNAELEKDRIERGNDPLPGSDLIFHYATEIMEVMEELRHTDADGKPQATAAHAFIGCYEFGAEATRVQRKFLNTPPSVEVVVPDEMAWPQAVQQIEYILSDLKNWIEQKTECRLVDLKLVPDGERRGCF